MTDKKKMTAYNPSAATDGKQSKSNKPNNIITEKHEGRNTQNVNIFREVKNRIGMADAARLYGVNISRGGLVNCIFHNDRHPSMKLYGDHYHCFACGAHGDVIAFTAQLYGLSPIDAARKLAGDFGIEVGSVPASKPPEIRKQEPYMTENEAFILIRDYVSALKTYRRMYCPGSPTEELHPLYIRALRELPVYENHLDILTSGSKEDKTDFLLNGRRFFDELRAKLRSARLAV